MRQLRQLIRSLGSLKGLGCAAATQAAEQQGGKACAQAVLNRGFPSAASALQAAIQQQQPAAQLRPWQGPFVLDAVSQWTLQLQSLAGAAPLLEPVLENAVEPVVWQADSVMRKRKRKMNKHKHKKRMRRDRRKSR